MIRVRAQVWPKLVGTPEIMSIFRQSLLARVALVCTLAMALVSLPHMHAFAHAAMERADEARHASINLSPKDAGHSHDDGDEHERQPGHVHSHHASDHSHDTPYRLEHDQSIAPPRRATWHPANALSQCLGVSFGLERPPRAIIISIARPY